MIAQPADATTPDTEQIVRLADGLVGRIWGHFVARAAEFNLSIAEAKALQQLIPRYAT